MNWLEQLAARRRFGMKPGLDTIRALCAALSNPERRLRNVIHVAGTNGKGATCAILDAALAALGTTARYTSPHLVRLNERFFLNGAPVADAPLEAAAARVNSAAEGSQGDAAAELRPPIESLTFFEALTAVAFEVFAAADPDWTILETGLGGRLDATNICRPRLCVITRIGLDHCDWLGDTVERIAAEKAGIIKPGVPVVVGRNTPAVVEVFRRAAAEKGAPFYYAPELASDAEVPADFSLAGAFNRENCVTAIAALKVLASIFGFSFSVFSMRFANVVWPGRFQRVGAALVDGAHNPPAATALAAALAERGWRELDLVAGFCGDKDIAATLAILRPFVRRGFAVKTNNPRSLSAAATAAEMTRAGIDAVACESLADALAQTAAKLPQRETAAEISPRVLICGSLFLAGEALVELDAYPYAVRFDAAELLKMIK